MSSFNPKALFTVVATASLALAVGNSLARTRTVIATTQIYIWMSLFRFLTPAFLQKAMVR